MCENKNNCCTGEALQPESQELDWAAENKVRIFAELLRVPGMKLDLKYREVLWREVFKLLDIELPIEDDIDK